MAALALKVLLRVLAGAGTSFSVSTGEPGTSHGAMMSASVEGGACGWRSSGGRKSTSREMDEVADAMAREAGGVRVGQRSIRDGKGGDGDGDDKVKSNLRDIEHCPSAPGR